MIINRMLNRIFAGRKVRLKQRYFSTSKSIDDNIRNIAILAHIDAGKFILLTICFAQLFEYLHLHCFLQHRKNHNH